METSKGARLITISASLAGSRFASVGGRASDIEEILPRRFQLGD
jgi:hypothetical protein